MTKTFDKFTSAKAKNIYSKIGIYFGLIAYFLLLFLPFMVIILTSFTSDAEIASTTGFVWFPSELSGEGYRMVFEFDPNKTNGVPSLLLGFINTMWQTLLPSVVGLMISGLAAYAYAKYDFPGKSKFFASIIFMMTIPVSAGITGYLFFAQLGWTTGGASVLPLIIPGLFGSAGTIFFIYPYLKALPDGVLEAAKIDGMGFFGIFFKIVLPLSTPIFLSQFLFAFVGGYNNYSGALIYLANQKQLWTLQLALNQLVSYITGAGGYNNVACAAALMSMLPLLILYAFVQKFFIEGITVGSVKG